MKTVLAATDFSDNSVNAAIYAAEMAQVFGATLTLFHVVEPPLAISEVPVSGAAIDELLSAADRQIRLLKDKVLHKTGSKVEVVTEIREGSAISEINHYAREVKPMVVVMGSEKQAALDRVLAGGTTFEALVHLEWPLIVVPSDARFEMIKRVALACDLENVEGTVPIQQLKNIVHHFGAQLHVLYVGTGAARLSVVDAPETFKLREMLTELHPVYHFLPGDDIDNTIIQFLEAQNIDLLFVIPKKHGLLRRIFQHSHSKKMVLKANLPVMAVHGQ